MGRKLFFGMMVLILCFTVAGCSSAPTFEKMQVKPAELTQDETNILELVQYTNQKSKVFDFQLDGNAKSASVKCYTLDESGKWVERFGSSSTALYGPNGRISITFGNFDDGMKVAFQQGNGSSGGEIESGQKSQLKDFIQAEIFTDSVDVEYGKEIPLVMQILSTKGELVTPEIGWFEQPDKLMAQGYDKVFVVVVSFNDKAID